MSSYLFIDLCYKNKTIKNLVNYSNYEASILDLPETIVNSIKSLLEHNYEFKDEVIKSMLESKYDPGKDSLLDYVLYNGKFNLSRRFGNKVYYRTLDLDLLNSSIDSVKFSIKSDKKEINDQKELISIIKDYKMVTEEAVNVAILKTNEAKDMINSCKDDIKIKSKVLWNLRKLKLIYYILRLFPNLNLKYYYGK